MNQEIANIFYEMAEIYQLKNIKWKPQAYIVAAQTLESLKKDVSEIYKEKGEKGIDELSGIGEGITKKIIEYIKTGKINKFEELKKSVPSGLYDMMNIPGIGSKKALMFYNKFKIKNIEELENAVKLGKIKEIPGFKEKSIKNILQGIDILKHQKGRISYSEAEKIGKKLISEISKIQGVEKVEIAGSFRRKKPTIGDFDIVVQVKKGKEKSVGEKFVKLNFIKEILGKGEDKVTVILNSGIQVDLRFFNSDNYGSGLLYFTGDKQHNIWLRKIAIKKDFKLNEYGLYKGKKRIAGKTEKEIYSKLGLKVFNPEERVGEIR